jgi:hypothetical protein
LKIEMKRGKIDDIRSRKDDEIADLLTKQLIEFAQLLYGKAVRSVQSVAK